MDERRWKDRPIAKLKFFGLCLTYIVYLVIGACVFDAIESPIEQQKRVDILDVRKAFLENASCITGKVLSLN